MSLHTVAMKQKFDLRLFWIKFEMYSTGCPLQTGSNTLCNNSLLLTLLYHDEAQCEIKDCLQHNAQSVKCINLNNFKVVSDELLDVKCP